MVLGLLHKKRGLIWGYMLIALLIFWVGAQSAFAQPFSANYDCGDQTSIGQDECEALVAIYDATGGESWTNSTNWLQNDDPCSWFGVLCSNGHIVTLDLNNNNLTGNLPIEIGGFPYLQTLTLNNNPLTGPVPVTITFLDLVLFHFQGTNLCEPTDPTFQDWFSQIVYRLSSGLYCATLEPTLSNAGLTLTAAAAVADLPWPQQTLTAMAQDVAETPTSSSPHFSTATPEPSPTRVSDGQTATPAIIGDADQVIGDFAGMQESGTKSGQPAKDGKSGFLSNIPTTWLLLLLVPIALIAVGVYLELRDRKKGDESRKKSGSAFESWVSSEEDENGGEEEKEEEKEEEDDYGDFDMYDFGGN